MTPEALNLFLLLACGLAAVAVLTCFAKERPNRNPPPNHPRPPAPPLPPRPKS